MQDEIRLYIEKNILRGQTRIDDDTSLYQSGLLSSMSHLKLMNFLERKFRVSIAASVIDMDSFDTVSKISQVITQLLSEDRAPTR